MPPHPFPLTPSPVQLTHPTTCKHRPHKLIIYQRDRSRRLTDLPAAIALLRTHLPPPLWDITVLTHATDRSPCELAHLLHNVDVLVTPHGFQSMLLLFLPQPSILFEIFPYRYYKRGYGPFGHEYGVVHGGVMSPPDHPWLSLATPLLSLLPTPLCMLSKLCREVARGTDARLTPHGARRLAQLVRAHGPALDPALSLREGPPPRPDPVTGRYPYRTALYWQGAGGEEGGAGGVFYKCAQAAAAGAGTRVDAGAGVGAGSGGKNATSMMTAM